MDGKRRRRLTGRRDAKSGIIQRNPKKQGKSPFFLKGLFL
jgi:hypothetical protein